MKNYLRKRIYKWHRITGLMVAIPVVLWTLSGFLHPVMNAFKPEVNNSLPPIVIDTSRIKLSLEQALTMHQIQSIRNFRIIEKHGAFYYQVKQPGADSLTYISCYNGQLMVNGDQQYAAYLAQRFVSDPNGSKGDHHTGAAADLATVVKKSTSNNHHNKANILDVQLVKEFNTEYKNSNVYLPVYRVLFDRDDDLRLYIETSTGKLATAIDGKRSLYIHFFALTHSWSFLDGMGMIKHIIIGFLSILCFLTSLFGFIVYNIIGKTKKPLAKNRSWHRTMGNVFVVTTLLYAFSGGWHSLHKINKEDNPQVQEQNEFRVNELDLPIHVIAGKIKKDQQLSGISVVRMNERNFWQVSTINKGKLQRKYFETKTLHDLPGGDEAYGRYLASELAGKPINRISHSRPVYKFNDRYSMMKKRLPVVEVSFGEDKNYYVETSTGFLSAVSSTADQAERFSFSNLHMHHYWEDWFGKQKGKALKNIVLIASTLGLLLLAVTGMFMYIRKRRKL